MRVKTFLRMLRIIAAVTLFFFSWSFGPIYAAVAYAAAPEGQKSVASSQKPGVQQRTETSGDRFEKALEAIRENVGKAGEKASRGEDNAKELETIKAKRADIESADVEFKKEFAATEMKLKDAKLPKEILDRHAKFVKHYEDNLKELRTNLDDVEQATTPSDRRAKIEKARLHLEKVKAPSKHQKLDPNNLPFKARKAGKNVAPRLKKEDFERDFPKQKSQNKLKIAGVFDLYSAIRTPQSAKSYKPILLAFNDTVSDVPFQLPRRAAGESWGEGVMPQIAFTDSAPFILAQATGQPSADDLAETPDIQFTDAIRAKAQELGGKPVNIYNWIRNNIEYAPTYGSIQGADMCLQSKICNDMDTASLLIALLRVSGIYAHYVYGTVEVPIDKVMNWVGGFTDSTSALNYFASGNVPVISVIKGSTIVAAQMEHVWVKAFVDYIPSMGAVHRQGNAWIPLDASYKQYIYADGIDLQAAVPFDGQNLADQIKATSTINTQDSYVTNVSTTLIQNALAEYNAQLESYVTNTLPNATPADILGKKDVIPKNQPILPASLPYKVVVAGAEVSEIPDQFRYKVTVVLADTANPGNPSITYTANVAQLAGKRFTLSYDPATAADQATINNYLAQYATNIPAYIVQFKPALKIEGAAVAIGEAIGMGNAQTLTISIVSPSGTEIVTHDLSAGDYTAIGINPATISLDALNNRVNKNDFSEPVGEMLHQTALSYWAEADAFNNVIAKTLRVNNLRLPSELAASTKVSVSYLYGVPADATYNSRNIDVKLNSQAVSTRTTDATKEISYMQQSGITSSFLEGAIMDQLFGGNIGDSISAATALKAANDLGIPIYKVDSSNAAAILPQLQVAESVKSEISNAINAGLMVQIPKTSITQSGWTGSGYIISNLTDGSGAYRISGGLNGGTNNTGVNTVAGIPAVPISGAPAFVVNSLVGNGSSGVLGLKVVGGLVVGIVLAPEIAAGVASGVAEAAAAILLIILIIGAIQSLLDKLPPKFEKFRHYTKEASAKLIWVTNEILAGIDRGDLIFLGVYVSDLTIEPVTDYDRLQIATILRMPPPPEAPDPSRVTAYVDVMIDRNRVGLISFQIKYPNQYLYPHPVMWNDGVRIKFLGVGPFISLP